MTNEAKPVTYVWDYTVVAGNNVIGEMRTKEVEGVTTTYT